MAFSRTCSWRTFNIEASVPGPLRAKYFLRAGNGDADADVFEIGLFEDLLQRSERIEGAHFEIAPGHFKEIAGLEVWQSVQHAVSGENPQTGRVHVDEGHHHFARVGKFGVIFFVRQRSFVAMMAIGDEQFLVTHQLLNFCDTGGIADLVDAVHRVIFVFSLRRWGLPWRRRPAAHPPCNPDPDRA